MEKNLISKLFLLLLLVGVIYGSYLVFKPFLMEFLVAAVLTSIFYRPYLWLKAKIGKKTASLVMCVFIVLIVIIPLINLVVFSAQKSITAYGTVTEFMQKNTFRDVVGEDTINEAERLLGINSESLKSFVIDSAKTVSNFLVEATTTIIKGTTNFFISIVAILFIMFFFFVDGAKMAERGKDWLPLPKKHSEEIFLKFREVSYSTVLATFVTAIAQGLIGGIGYFIVGVPVFFLAILTAFFSLIPYLGAGIVWFPVGVYLLIIGEIWQGIFILIWGALIVSFVDNIIRAYVIKGKSQAHPIFIIFSILGGIVLFGFWGVIIGPLIISLALTILHIYEQEYSGVLEEK